jgi:uncharacterized protein YbjT (DUF2867 family)
VHGDLTDPTTLADPLAGVDGLFLIPGYPGVAAAAKAAGLARIVLLSGGAAVATNADNALSAYMISSERAVRDSGLPWTILRPYAFMSNALRWLDQLSTGDIVREPFATVPAAATDPFDIAAVAAAALTTADHEGQTYAVSGPESLLPAERLRILAEILGRDLRLEALSNEEARTTMTAQMPAEYVDAFFSFYVDGTIDESTPQPTVEQLLGRAPRTFLDWAKAHADAFR